MSREERYQEELEQRIMKHGKKLRGLFNRSNARILAEINDLYARFAESGEELVSLIYNASRLDLILGSIRTILKELGQEEDSPKNSRSAGRTAGGQWATAQSFLQHGHCCLSFRWTRGR
ncbi:hypothetical protein [Brevibacillus thermoruber]|uniref:hypothetical protein n=1 Tax=Brevibacillus thermoruber TaxID=33942 RepID=UPI002F3606D2